MSRHRFPIGTQFHARHASNNRAHPVVRTVVEQLTTVNSKGEVVRLAYAVEHEFCGQRVLQTDVVDTTVARNLLPEYQHLLSTGSAP
jgi:hypothetical protein